MLPPLWKSEISWATNGRSSAWVPRDAEANRALAVAESRPRARAALRHRPPARAPAHGRQPGGRQDAPTPADPARRVRHGERHADDGRPDRRPAAGGHRAAIRCRHPWDHLEDEWGTVKAAGLS